MEGTCEDEHARGGYLAAGGVCDAREVDHVTELPRVVETVDQHQRRGHVPAGPSRVIVMAAPPCAHDHR